MFYTANFTLNLTSFLEGHRKMVCLCTLDEGEMNEKLLLVSVIKMSPYLIYFIKKFPRVVLKGKDRSRILLQDTLEKKARGPK